MFGSVETIGEAGVFGQVMGLVAVTLAFFAGGAYLGRDVSSGASLICFIVAIGCIVGLNAAVRRSESLAITLLFALGLVLGFSIGATLHYYAETNPGAVWEAGACTCLFVAGLGATGYAIRRDLAPIRRYFFFALLALIVFGLIATFVAIPGSNVLYSVLGLVIFAGFTVIDFNRLRRAGRMETVPLAAGIFLDIVNVFLLLLNLFGGGSRR